MMSQYRGPHLPGTDTDGEDGGASAATVQITTRFYTMVDQPSPGTGTDGDKDDHSGMHSSDDSSYRFRGPPHMGTGGWPAPETRQELCEAITKELERITGISREEILEDMNEQLKSGNMQIPEEIFEDEDHLEHARQMICNEPVLKSLMCRLIPGFAEALESQELWRQWMRFVREDFFRGSKKDPPQDSQPRHFDDLSGPKHLNDFSDDEL
uniref:Uncharacterized protein n=1 Tax=Fibrocapsa japonica TaxID=94617 RepID=A0A7S2UZ17_9STRA